MSKNASLCCTIHAWPESAGSKLSPLMTMMRLIGTVMQALNETFFGMVLHKGSVRLCPSMQDIMACPAQKYSIIVKVITPSTS